MRLIDADVFVSYLKEAIKGKDTLNVLIMEKFISMVEIMAEKEPKNQWIPCSERLPEVGVNVLVCDIDNDIYLTHMSPYKSFYDEFFDYLKNVVAWMPLPEPYVGKDQ